MEEPVATLNGQLACVAKAVDAPNRTPAAVVDVIGAQYIAHGCAGESNADVNLTFDPLGSYLAALVEGEGRMTLIRA